MICRAKCFYIFEYGSHFVGVGGGRRVPPCAPSPLKQIVPISASIYNVFHSVIYKFCEIAHANLQIFINNNNEGENHSELIDEKDSAVPAIILIHR